MMFAIIETIPAFLEPIKIPIRINKPPIMLGIKNICPNPSKTD